MRNAHYWKSAGRTAAPSSILVFDTETLPHPVSGTKAGEIHKLRLGVAIHYRLEKGKRTRQSECVFRTKEEFWTYVESKLSKDRPLWVFAHNLPFDIGVVGGWGVFCSNRCSWDSAVYEAGVSLFRGVMDSHPIIFGDTCNYYHCSLATVGKAVGLPKMPMPEFSADDATWVEYCRNDVLVTAAGVDALLAFWRENEMGPWGATIASLAFSAFRHRFMKHKILVHTCEEALALERASYYGGRVDTAFIGRVPAPVIHECDYSSLYPSCCMHDMPYYFDGMIFNPRPASLIQCLRTHMVTADVTLRTQDRAYPCRIGSRVYHPLGTYRTTLADPELRVAVESGHVLYVHAASIYRKAPIFVDYMTSLYTLKCRYEEEKNPAFRTLCKYLMNSLYGKTGQLSPRWATYGTEALRLLAVQHNLAEDALDHYSTLRHDFDYGSCSWSIPEIREVIHLRNLWGIVEIQVGRTESRDSCPAIASTVTSHGRLLLTKAQQTAGAGHWYYSDTDSVWVDSEGLAALNAAGMIGHGVLGMLEHARDVHGLVIHGRKDYEYEGGRKLKGIKGTAEEVEPAVFQQLHFPSTLTQFRDKLSDGVFVRSVMKRLRRVVDWCEVTPGGWTRPFQFPDERPGDP